ncbi:MAG: bifunctional metallophosphatase/5'-nucleotidase [Cyanobacteria bacterium NC_groundwater_1444_Ag_S-0.65um_54_12]|nr:bifunctional metallophosphatase/5'-nucleotidase [Cyanobacteria bacterium NC_groundwater_1444_Ag_S-0.65um_54_12]
MFRYLLLTISLSLMLDCSAWAAPARLILLHTNDTHDHLLPFDKKDLKSVGGIARRGTLIKQVLAQNPGQVLVLDAGDTFQGTPLFNFFHGKADFEAMDAAAYDATTVGNHDLDEGLVNLQQQYRGRRFKIINSNLVDPASLKPIFTSAMLFERAGLKIGVFGLLGEKSAWPAIAAKHQAGLKVLDREIVARQMINELQAKKADVIVLLSHSGYEEDKELAARVAGIHVIVGGHSHTKIPSPAAVKNGAWTTYVLQAYQWGEYLGRMDLDIESGKVISQDGYLIPVMGDTPEEPAVAKLVESYDVQIRAKMAAIIGQAPRGLSWEAKYEHDCELGNWATDAMRKRTGTEIAILNSGGLRAPLNAGPIKVGDIYAAFPFENRLVRLVMSGQLICDLLNHVTARQAGMLQVSGLSWRIVGEKAVDIMVGSEPINPERSYSVTTIDYLAQGNDRYTMFPQATNYEDLGLLLRDCLLEETKSVATVNQPPLGRIKIVR